MTKQDAIKEAYGENWEKVKSKIVFGSWLDNDDVLDLDIIDWVKENCYQGSIPDLIWRPKTLHGLECNNGWKSIESENDLPKEDCDCFFIVPYGDDKMYNGKYYKAYKEFRIGSNCYSGELCSHYQLIQIPELPIYYEK